MFLEGAAFKVCLNAASRLGERTAGEAARYLAEEAPVT